MGRLDIKMPCYKKRNPHYKYRTGLTAAMFLKIKYSACHSNPKPEANVYHLCSFCHPFVSTPTAGVYFRKYIALDSWISDLSRHRKEPVIPSSWNRKIFMVSQYWWKWFAGLWQRWRDLISNKDISLLQWGMARWRPLVGLLSWHTLIVVS